MPNDGSTPEFNYLLWSNKHEAWWRPNARGYTKDRTEAGQYTEAEAIRRVVDSARHGDREKVTCMVVDVHDPIRGLRSTRDHVQVSEAIDALDTGAAPRVADPQVSNALETYMDPAGVDPEVKEAVGRAVAGVTGLGYAVLSAQGTRRDDGAVEVVVSWME